MLRIIQQNQCLERSLRRNVKKCKENFQGTHYYALPSIKKKKEKDIGVEKLQTLQNLY